jgi:hypothetical protein
MRGTHLPLPSRRASAFAVEAAALVSKPFWLANACMNRVSRAKTACVCPCRAPPIRAHAHTHMFTAWTRLAFQQKQRHRYVPALLPKDCYIGDEIRCLGEGFSPFGVVLQVTLPWSFPIKVWLHARSRFLLRSARIKSSLGLRSSNP